MDDANLSLSLLYNELMPLYIDMLYHTTMGGGFE
jgi:hypothetical protein